MGYHTRVIEKGVYGQSSKIKEEIEELQDAELQKNKIMVLIELSDLICAVKGYLDAQYPDFSIDDLIKMADATHSAFVDGTRK